MYVCIYNRYIYSIYTVNKPIIIYILVTKYSIIIHEIREVIIVLSCTYRTYISGPTLQVL